MSSMYARSILWMETKSSVGSKCSIGILRSGKFATKKFLLQRGKCPQSFHTQGLPYTHGKIMTNMKVNILILWFFLLQAQLLFTFGMVALFIFHKPTLELSQKNPGLVLVAAITTLIVVISMACCESARRSFPLNFICLGIFTVAESFLVGAIAGRYNSEAVNRRNNLISCRHRTCFERFFIIAEWIWVCGRNM